MSEIKGLPTNAQISAQQKVDDKRYVPKPYRNIAEGMEKQFAEHLINQMHNSVDYNDEPSTASNYYKSILNSERADRLVDGEQLGLQKVILDQVYPKRFRNEIAYNAWLTAEKSKMANRNQVQMNKKNNPYQNVEMTSKGDQHE